MARGRMHDRDLHQMGDTASSGWADDGSRRATARMVGLVLDVGPAATLPGRRASVRFYPPHLPSGTRASQGLGELAVQVTQVPGALG